MGLSIGAAALDNAMLGSQQISAIMLGTQEVWSAFKLPEFDGLHALFGDKTKGYIEMYSSGTLTLAKGTYDLFVVGGGGSGSSGQYRVDDEGSEFEWLGSGGGSGYTKTVKSVKISGNMSVSIASGGAGNPYNRSAGYAGGSTNISNELSTVIIEAAGGQGGTKENTKGVYGYAAGNGGSGGSVGCASGRYTTGHVGAGGSDGSDGELSRYSSQTPPASGLGQHTTTRSFEDSNGVLYAGGGSGSGDNKSVIANGGAGGGGKGSDLDRTPATSGLPNTGGGGGGAYDIKPSGAGGSGIAIVRWGY